jgi:glycine oxidase
MFTPLWHVDHNNGPLFNVGVDGLETIPKLAAELLEAGVDPLFRQCGVLKVALTPDEMGILKSDLVWQAELGTGVRWLDSDEVLDIVPEINPRVLGGVLSPTEGHVTGQSFVNSLVHAGSRLGATFLEGMEVIRLETDGRRVTGVTTSKDMYYAEHTIIAAGPWSGMVRRWIPEPIPVRPVKGQRLLLRKRGFLPKVIVHSFMGTSIPQADGNILVGATRHDDEFDQDVTVDGITTIIQNATTVLPTLRDARFIEARAGVRPGSPDGVPIIGPIPQWSGLSIASGHEGCGVMLSPGTARLVADYISTGDAAPLEPFSISRFWER